MANTANTKSRIGDLLDSAAAVAVEEDISLEVMFAVLRSAYDRRVCRAAVLAAGEDPAGAECVTKFVTTTGGLPSDYPSDSPSEAVDAYSHFLEKWHKEGSE